jgi:hypothetical protein
MTSKSSPTGRRHRSRLVQTYTQARAVLPYVASILRSLREHRLDALRHHLAAKRLADQPGRPRRDRLLAQAEAAREACRADAEYQRTLAELELLGIHCLDPVACRAIVTVSQAGKRVDYVYDLFDPQPLRFCWAEPEPALGQGRRADED